MAAGAADVGENCVAGEASIVNRKRSEQAFFAVVGSVGAALMARELARRGVPRRAPLETASTRAKKLTMPSHRVACERCSTCCGCRPAGPLPSQALMIALQLMASDTMPVLRTSNKSRRVCKGTRKSRKVAGTFPGYFVSASAPATFVLACPHPPHPIRSSL